MSWLVELKCRREKRDRAAESTSVADRKCDHYSNMAKIELVMLVMAVLSAVTNIFIFHK